MAKIDKRTIGKVALGVTGVALATGVVAAGAALATNKKARTKLTNGVKSTVKEVGRMRKAIEEGNGAYQAYQHRIGMGKGRKRTAKKSNTGKKAGMEKTEHEEPKEEISSL